MPTPEQKTQCYILCCWFTCLLISFVWMNGQKIYSCLAGEENIIEIYPNGKWRYIG
ncbi:DUF6888 family protein [Nostoc sp.]|uniref:DUF6888 family protein n=1 Tax=Nostoc sp. TaxID=1180 RepID=UPI003FA61527